MIGPCGFRWTAPAKMERQVIIDAEHVCMVRERGRHEHFCVCGATHKPGYHRQPHPTRGKDQTKLSPQPAPGAGEDANGVSA